MPLASGWGNAGKRNGKKKRNVWNPSRAMVESCSFTWRCVCSVEKRLPSISKPGSPFLHVFFWNPKQLDNNTQTLHVYRICRSVGVVPGGSMGRHIWQSHMGYETNRRSWIRRVRGGHHRIHRKTWSLQMARKPVPTRVPTGQCNRR